MIRPCSVWLLSVSKFERLAGVLTDEPNTSLSLPAAQTPVLDPRASKAGRSPLWRSIGAIILTSALLLESITSALMISNADISDNATYS